VYVTASGYFGTGVNIASGQTYKEGGSQINLSDLASSTSAELAAILSNETGTNLSVFSDDPTLHSPSITLDNDEWIMALNSSGVNSNLIRLNSSDLVEFGTLYAFAFDSVSFIYPIITLGNDQWIRAFNSVDSVAYLIKLDESNLITFGQTVNLSSLYCVADAGNIVLWNQPNVSSVFGDTLSGKFTIDDEEVFRIQGVADGAGGLINGQTGVVERKPIRTVTDTTSITNLDYAILCDATLSGIVVNLPTPASAYNRIYRIKAINVSNAVWVQCASGNIDGTLGSTGVQLTTIYDAIEVHSDGTNWYIW
jgi:hypothetical protein